MPFCTQCGHQVAGTDIFCAACGKRQFSPGATPRAAADPFSGVSPRTASVLCYIPTIGWLAAVIVLTGRKFRNDHIVRFHAFQGLYLFALWLLVQWVIHPMIDGIHYRFPHPVHLLDALLIGVAVFMIVKASQDEPYVLPVIGELAQRSAAEQ